MPNPALREEIQDAFNRHDLPIPLSLLDDLVELYPNPSREVLTGILARHGLAHYIDDGVLLNHLMSWATTRQEVKKEWCKHIRLSRDNWVYCSNWELEDAPYSPHGDGFRLPNTWEICPVKGCHAKKPE